MKSSAFRGVVWGLAVLVCVVGIWLSMHLALLHFRTSSKDESGLLNQACTSFATSSCQKVAQSRWAWFPPKPDPKAAQEQSAQADKGEGADADGAKGSETAATGQKPQERKIRIPTAQLGLIYFSVVLCWLIFTGPAPATRKGVHLLFVLGTLLGVPASIFFEYIMWTQLEAWCPLCLATHIGSVLLPVFALLLWPRGSQVEEDDPPAPVLTSEPQTSGLFAPAPATPAKRWSDAGRTWPTNYAIMTSVVAAVLLVGAQHFFIVNRSSIMEGTRDKFYKELYEKKWMAYERHWEHHFMAWSLQQALDIPIEDRPVRGPADAPHTIVVFSDFECPSCARFEQYLLKSVLPLKLKGQPAYKLIFKHWPICKDCNDTIEGNSLHPAACDAALATEAARMLGGDEAFWKMHDALFANQSKWKKSKDFLPYARAIGLDEAEFVKAMGSSEALSRVRADIADGAGLGSQAKNPKLAEEIKVNSTPSIFVDGKLLKSPQFGNTWKRIMMMPPPNPTPATPESADNADPAPSPAHPVEQ